MWCNDCEMCIDPLVIKEVHSELPEKPYEIFYECPKCHGYDLEDSVICGSCGTEVSRLKTYGTKHICLDCIISFKRDFDNFIDKLDDEDRQIFEMLYQEVELL